MHFSSTQWTNYLQDPATGSGIDSMSVLTAMGPNQAGSELTSTEIKLGTSELGRRSRNWTTQSAFLYVSSQLDD